MNSLKSFGNALIRRKTFTTLEADTPQGENLSPTQLKRCLGTLDLTALGIGSTLGLGIYVLAGTVASTKAGPAVVLSFAVAALASVFAGLCYAEFAARVPRAGSAYVYSYVTVGELMAFIIGWNLVLEYVIGTASVARGYSGYIDYLCHGAISDWFKSILPMHLSGLSGYVDFLSFGLTMALTVMLCIGVQESTRFNSIFTCLNLLVVLYVVICGAFKADLKNWKLSKDEIPDYGGSGGFFPFGFSGMMSGAATAFFGFVGFDIIASTGEEVKNPQRSMPISIVLSLTFIFLAYFGISIVQTLMWPYWDQNNTAPLPYVFERVGWPSAQYIIAVGGLAGLSTSLLGSLFPLPRVLYAMATDGLIFRWLGWVNSRTQTPILSTIFSGIFAGGMAAIFNIDELADMMSIGTLLAYTLVAVSVLILRFRYEPPKEFDISLKKITEESDQGINVESVADFFRLLFNTGGATSANRATSKMSIFLVSWINLEIVILNVLLVVYEDSIISLQDWGPIAVLIFNIALILLGGFALARQPRSGAKLPFQVPWVPAVPLLSCFINVYLMLKLSQATWIRFGVWMIIGFVIYFFYGLRNSEERITSEQLIQPASSSSAKNDSMAGNKDLDESSESIHSERSSAVLVN